MPHTRARACDRLPLSTLTFASFPADGTRNVPLDATPLIPAAAPGTFDFAARTGLALQQGPDFDVVTVVDADVVADGLVVVGEYGREEAVVRLVPRAPLEPITLYRLVDDAGSIAEFTTGTDTAVDAAPVLLAPTATLVDSTGANRDDTGFECAFDGIATIAVQPAVDNDSVPLIGVATVVGDVDDDPLQGLGSPTLTVFGDGPLTWDVAVMDSAGRRSPSTTVSADLSVVGGCSQSGTGAAPLAGLGMLLLRRRRQAHRPS
jgi:MYXO-CTERM domain-containing protein